MKSASLMPRVGRQWRRFRTGLMFATFGMASSLMAVTLLPLIRLLPLQQKKKRAWGLGLVHLCLKSFTKMGILLRLYQLEVVKPATGIGPTPCLFVANHPSLMDVVLIMGEIKGSNCLIKKSLFENRFIGAMVSGAGFLPNDAGPVLIELVRRNVADGNSLIIFPEGTRSPASGVHPFGRGTAQIATRLSLPIVPILVSCNPRTLQKGCRWHEVPNRRVLFRLEFQAPLALPDAISREPSQPLKVRKLTRFLEQYFQSALPEKAKANSSE